MKRRGQNANNDNKNKQKFNPITLQPIQNFSDFKNKTPINNNQSFNPITQEPINTPNISNNNNLQRDNLMNNPNLNRNYINNNPLY